jgi:asparagine synthase (glutamine-hydrolysing)
MSHFFGSISLQKGPALPDIAVRMKRSMDFFPCDGEGGFLSDNVFVFNKYLNTTPESRTIHPICRNERFILAATCRLDNRDELAKKLEAPITLSDHEYLLAAYTYWQEKCLDHLIGDFSFIVWDIIEEKLFMAKDQLGIKPLFYLEENGILYFSTNIIAIKAAFDDHLPLNDQYIAKALKVFPPEAGETFFKNIHRLKPAHYCYFNQKGLQTEKRYWELTPIDSSPYKTHEQLYNKLYELFVEAVRCRLRTFKNIGCQLSGGIDSSAIAVLASRLIDKNRLHTFSYVLNDETRRYSEKKIDEQDTQNEIINYALLNKENHHPIDSFYYTSVQEQLDMSNKIMGGYANSDSIWQDSIFKAAQKYGVGVSLSGFPGDECVSNNGTNYYYDYFGRKNVKKTFSFLIANKWPGVKQFINYFRAKYKGTIQFGYAAVQNERNLLQTSSAYNSRLKDDSFAFYPTFKETIKNSICRPHTCLRCESEGAYASQYGIETAYPLADIRLIQFVYSLPVELFKPHPYKRMLFRNLCKGILPDKVRLQEKNNGAMTLAFAEYWFKTQFTEFENLEIINYNDLFDLKKYKNMVDNFKKTENGFPPVIMHYLSEFIKRNRPVVK